MTLKKWIALAEVIPVKGNETLGSRPKGAYVNVVGVAPSQEAFRRGVAEFCEQMGFVLVALESVDELKQRTAHHEVEPSLLAAAAALSDQRPFCFGVFDTFPLS